MLFRSAARAVGAKEVFDPSKPETQDQLMALPGGVWGVADFVGAAPTATLGMAVLRKGGRYVVVGLYGGEVPLSLVPMAQRALTIQGSYVGSLQELQEVVDLAKSGKLQSIPTALCTLEEVSGVLDQLKQGGVIGRVVAKI